MGKFEIEKKVRLSAEEALKAAKEAISADNKVEKVVDKCIASIKKASLAGKTEVLVMVGALREQPLIVGGVITELKALGYSAYYTGRRPSGGQGLRINWGGKQGSPYHY